MTDLTVVALGGNALASPRDPGGFAGERDAIQTATEELAVLADGGRLLIVHGNGPQVGRLLDAPGYGDAKDLDVHVAQTQGELGYLIVAALDSRLGSGSAVSLLTRVVVDPTDHEFASPSKPVGPVLSDAPPGLPAVALPDGGWRRVVPSPRPLRVVEQQAIDTLLTDRHVIAGGGGGIAVDDTGAPFAAVVDKDWTASLLAIGLGARALINITDVPHAARDYAGPAEARIAQLSADEAEDLLAADQFAPGSMSPKVESAVEFVRATGHRAVITTIGQVQGALAGRSGTLVLAD